ncbi:E3 ubiquitin-protein ligase RBBP6 isoform X3 [Oryzias melastigma]|uniref:E3 ubiquitin-protein ligase RBBP6 isoform X3 n=1 Tax=Oryzias melastigma TaxID=30732 RepID=UPI000CF8247A|nr:E3 ubiquitin-protein ligase RBBP6 isoform X3 [Oryzias melastigma]
MAHIHYKFSSKLSYDTVVFDGPHITLTDLKRRIMGREKLRAADCDLQITNAQTKEEYTEDEELIPKGSSVIVRRIPISGVKSSSSSKTLNTERSHGQAQHSFGASRAQMEDQSSTKALSFFAKMQMANLVDADVPEEDKIKFMMNQSSYSTMNLNTKLGTVLPENYTCFRCGNAGHHIRNCPTSGDKNFEAPQRLKKSTGIPRSFMVEVDDPNIKGVMVTNCGRYAIPAIDAEAYAIGKKERPPFVPQEQPKSESEDEPVPDELLCLICHDLLDDAVVIHCCGNSYCDDCIRTSLLDSEDHVCPTCGQSSVSPDSLTANKFLRQAVNNFKKERVGVNSSRKKPSIAQALNSTPIPGPAPPPLKQLLQPPPMQQDSPMNRLKASKPSSSRAPDVVVPVAADPPCANSSAKSSPPLVQSLATAELETEGKNDSSAVSPDKDPPDGLSGLVSEVSQTQETEVKEKPSSTASTDPVMTSSSTWDGTLSSSGFSSGGMTESNSQQLRNASSSSSPSFSFLSPFCPNSLASAPIPVHQPNSAYPPGYQPATNTWTLPPRDAPPSALIPKEWYGYHRNERDRPSPSHSNLKTSQSYALSSTHSRVSHRDSHPRSYPSTYSFGYKRPPSSTSSSSSPRGGYHSRSNSSSDQQKSRHHTRHPLKGSALRSRSSKRRGERSGREAGGPPRADADVANSRLELDIQLYLQWRKEFQDWYDKCYAHFYQLPFPPPPLPPHPQECHDSGRNSGRTNDRSPLSERSSFSRSPSSQSSTDSRSTTSRSSSDSCSDKASEGHSPPSRTSSGGRHTPSNDKSQLRELPESGTEKNTEIPQQKPGGKQQLSPQTHNQREEKVFQRRGRGGASSPDQSRGENRTETVNKNPSDSVQPHIKLEKPLDKEKEQERKSKEEKSLQRNQIRKRESREKDQEEKKQRIKSSSKAETGRTEQKKIIRKRKREDSENLERRRGPQSSTSQKTAENPESNRNKKSQTPSDRKKKKVEKKERTSLTEKDIWEGGMKVMPQKKISININLEGKLKERNDEEKSSGFDMNVEEQTVEADEEEENQDEEKTENRTDEPKDSDKEQIRSNEKKASDYKEEECKLEKEHIQTKKEDLDLWHCAFSTAGEDETGKEAAEPVGAQKGDDVVQEGKAEPRSRESTSKRLHQGQKKSRDDRSNFSVEGSCGGEGRLEKKRTGKMEENGQERDEATASESKEVPCVEKQKNEWTDEGRIKADSSSPAPVPPDPSEPKNNMETAEQSKQQEQQRGRDRDLAPSSGRKRSLSPNRDEERRERSSRRRENDAQQERKRLKSGTREEERRKSTSVPKRNLPSLLSQEAERRDQQQHRGGHSSRKTSCTYKEKESSSISEVSSLPYHSASKTQRDNNRFHRASYHPSVNQREARSQPSPPPLFHFHSFSSLHRGGPDWPPTQCKSRNEKGERRSDGGQSASKERRCRRDEEERQRPGRSGDARSSESQGKKHKRETSHNWRSGQTREMQM